MMTTTTSIVQPLPSHLVHNSARVTAPLNEQVVADDVQRVAIMEELSVIQAVARLMIGSDIVPQSMVGEIITTGTPQGGVGRLIELI